MASVKLVRLDRWRTGLVTPSDASDPVVLDVSDGLWEFVSAKQRVGSPDSWDFPDDWTPLIENWGEVEPMLLALTESWADDPARFDSVAIRYSQIATKLPPLTGPSSRTFAAGANFADHAAAAFTAINGQAVDPDTLRAERTDGLPPWGFFVVPGTVSADGAVVKPPRGTAKLDYEAEIAVVLGSGGRDLRPEDITFWGYTAACDFSIRDPFVGIGGPIDRGPLNWGLVKNWDTGNLLGPWIATLGPDDDVNQIDVDLRVNGELRQSVNTRGMTYSFAEIAAYLSRFIELRPGDAIVSGTGVGTAIESGAEGPYLTTGDEVSLTTAGGTLTASIASWD